MATVGGSRRLPDGGRVQHVDLAHPGVAGGEVGAPEAAPVLRRRRDHLPVDRSEAGDHEVLPGGEQVGDGCRRDAHLQCCGFPVDDLTPEARKGIRFVTRGEPSLPGLDAEALAAVALRSPEPAGHRRVVIDRFSPLRESAGGLDPIDAYLVRTLLVDAHRRVVLRSPELPEALLTDDGIDRRYLQMVAGLYRCLEPASEAFLAEVFPTGEGRVGRFRG